MRHGTSLANDAGIIISNPYRGILEYGLSARGVREVYCAARDAARDLLLDSATIVISSDFSRTKETAAILSQVLGAGAPILTPKLRERNFGRWERTATTNYERVWRNDASKTPDTHDGIESVEMVQNRVMSLINELENTYSEHTVVLVSHGDTLQILATAFINARPSTHRAFEPLGTSQIRPLTD